MLFFLSFHLDFAIQAFQCYIYLFYSISGDWRLLIGRAQNETKYKMTPPPLRRPPDLCVTANPNQRNAQSRMHLKFELCIR